VYKGGEKTDHLDGEIDVDTQGDKQGDMTITRKDGSKLITRRNGSIETVPA